MSSKLSVVNVVSKVSVCCFFSNSNRTLSPMALAGTAPGYCQYLLLDSFNESEAEISLVSGMLARLYPEAKVVRLTNNVIHQDVACDILRKGAFHTPYQAVLRLKYESFLGVKHEPELLFLPFDLPVMSAKLRRDLHRGLMMVHHGVLADREAVVRRLAPFQAEADASDDYLAKGLFKLRLRVALSRCEAKGCKILYAKFFHRKH